jgi:hypothetical protein
MNKLLIILITLFAIPLQAQDITNKLGGNTAAETYDVTDSADNVLFQVRGDGDVNIGGDDHLTATFSVFGSDSYGMYVNNSYIGAIFQSSGSGGIAIKGTASGPNSFGVTGYGNNYNFYAENASATDYGSASSIRWKNNIVEIENPLEKLAKIRGVSFNWDEAHGGNHDIGCIAEEVGRVLPEIVVYEENGIDANGMDYSKLTPLLIEAVKELSNKVDEQGQRIKDLENLLNK